MVDNLGHEERGRVDERRDEHGHEHHAAEGDAPLAHTPLLPRVERHGQEFQRRKFLGFGGGVRRGSLEEAKGCPGRRCGRVRRRELHPGGRRRQRRRLAHDQTQAIDANEQLDEQVRVRQHVAHKAEDEVLVELHQERPVEQGRILATKASALHHAYPEAGAQVDHVERRLGVQHAVDLVARLELPQDEHVEHVGDHGAEAHRRQHERPPHVDEQTQTLLLLLIGINHFMRLFFCSFLFYILVFAILTNIECE